MVGARWEHFAHGADIGVRGIGSTRAEAFNQVALALSAVISDPAQIRSVSAVELSCSAPDDIVLLVDWLNALVYAMATRRMLFGRYEVTIEDHRLEATAWGEAVEQSRHQPAVEVKGATYTSASVALAPDGTWCAQCVVDV
jgi:SHS2 domain-containing protein